MTTVLFAATVVMQVFVGRLARRIGLLPLLVIGLIALGAPAALYLVDHSLWWWLAVSVVRGAGFGILAVLGSILIAGVGEPHQLGRAIGLYGLAIAVGSMICTPLGVALATSGHFDWVAGAATALPLLALIGIAPIAGHVHETHEANAGPRAPAAEVIRRVAGPSLVLFCVTFTGGGLVSYLPIDRPSGSTAAVALFVYTVTGALCRFAAGSLGDRFGAMRILPVGLALAIGGALILGATVGLRGTAALYLAAGVFGLGLGTVQSLSLVVSFGRAGPTGATTASAYWNGAYDLGTSVGAFTVGAIAATGLGLGWTLAGCAGLMALSSVGLRLPRAG